MQKLALALLVALVGCHRTVVESAPSHGRLPSDVIPSAYALDLTFDLERGVMRGSSTIRLELSRERQTIWLHASGLRIGTVAILLANGKGVTVPTSAVDDMLRIDLPTPVSPQSITVAIAYERDLQVRSGAVFATTGPMKARTWFPCLDEPALKAPFDIAVTAPREATVVGPAHIERADGDRRQLARTRPLPPYLVSFAVGALTEVGHGRVRGFALAEDAPRFGYVVGQADALLAGLERYLGLPYPFDKLELVAVPGLDTAGYENAAAIHLSSEVVLVDPADEERRRTALEVLAHELAHMWFGGMVTPAWWDDVWLSEGFASLTSRRVLDQVEPGFGGDADRVESVLGAMHYDSVPSAQPIRHPVVTATDLRFDPLVYGKAMGLLAMVESYLGADRFHAAVTRYLTLPRFGSVTVDDFVRALENERAGAIVKSFVETPGVPWVTARAECPQLHLSQSRYVPMGSTADRHAEWTIPVCTRDECWLLDAPETVVEPKHCETTPFIDRDAAGYYRFAYGGDLARLSDTEILAVADSLAASISAGNGTVEQLFEALPRLAARRDRRLDHRVMETLRLIREHHLGDDAVPAFERYASRMFADRPRGFLGNPGENAADKLQRDAIVFFLVTVAREPALRARAAAHGKRILSASRHEVDVDLEDLCVGTALEDDKLLASTLAANDARLAGAAAFLRSPTQVERALAQAPQGQALRLAQGFLAHRETRDVARTWLAGHAHDASPQALAALCSRADAVWVREHFGDSADYARVSEAIELCAVLDERYRDSIVDVLLSGDTPRSSKASTATQ